MALRVGNMVTTPSYVDLCTDPSLYRSSTIFSRYELGIVVELLEALDALGREQVTYVKVLSSSGHIGWCMSRFLIPASQYRRGS
jgi:hypothetical protein